MALSINSLINSSNNYDDDDESNIFFANAFQFTNLLSDDITKNENVNIQLPEISDRKSNSVCGNYQYFLAQISCLSCDVLCKVVREDLKESKVKIAIYDLNSESEILKKCSHPNIIKMIGAGEQPRPFLVLEHLTGGTLADLLLSSSSCSIVSSCSLVAEAQSPIKSCKSSIFNLHTLPISFDRALHVSRSLCRAFQYLHEDLSAEFSVVFRNLKPESIGFSSEGSLKLFDFTLAAILLKPGSDVEKVEKLKGKVGSLRYMAPEMYLMQLYTESVDVYSFGILLWQLVTCEKPFDGYSSEQLVKEVGDIIYYTDHFVLPLNNYNPLFFTPPQVIHGGLRPALTDAHFSSYEQLQELLASCWASNPLDRPSFRSISEKLEVINNIHKKTKQSPKNKSRPNSSGEPCKFSDEISSEFSNSKITSDETCL